MMHTPVGTLEKDAVPPPYSATIHDQPSVIDMDVVSRVISLRNKDERNNLTNRYVRWGLFDWKFQILNKTENRN